VNEGVDNCDFCSIAAGRDQSAEMVAEAGSWLAFFPLNPATPGHTLIVPRIHVEHIWDVDPPLDGELMRACIEVGRAIKSALNAEGMNLITSAGKVAEQTVFHLHLHLVPRWEADGFGKIWPTGERYENVELADFADRIRVLLGER
jgi:histidine triad (HIT) family protein